MHCIYLCYQINKVKTLLTGSFSRTFYLLFPVCFDSELQRKRKILFTKQAYLYFFSTNSFIRVLKDVLNSNLIQIIYALIIHLKYISCIPLVVSSSSFSVTNSPLINISSHNSIGKFVSVFCQAENSNLFCSEPSSNDVFNCTQID